MECKVIDVHAHVFPDKVSEKAVASIGEYYGVVMTGAGTIEDLLGSGRKINVSKYIIHSTATKVEQVGVINDFIAEAQAQNDCFWGFGTLHPGLKRPEIEVQRILSLGLKGVKLHPEFQGFSIDDEIMMPIYEAVEGKLPLLMHMGDAVESSSRPKRLASIMDLFPGLTVIAAHLGGFMMWDESMKYLIGRNVYLDTSSSMWRLSEDKVVEIIRKHGADKVLFGTDYPMWTHEEEFRRFNRLDLTQEERELILWRNACRLLNGSI
jgi:predicted TIM-barrel fold metal-dependent hydrolase